MILLLFSEPRNLSACCRHLLNKPWWTSSAQGPPEPVVRTVPGGKVRKELVGTSTTQDPPIPVLHTVPGGQLHADPVWTSA